MVDALINPTRFYVQSSDGIFFEWDTPLSDISLEGQTFYVEGNAGADTLYVGNNITVDATHLGDGANKIYLQGNFDDYYVTSNNGEYTLTGKGDRNEVVTVKYSYRDKDGSNPSLENQLYFADGSISLGYKTLRVDGSWKKLSSVTFDTSSKTPEFPVEMPELQGGDITKVFISDPTGANVTPFKPGASIEVQGNAGADQVYVGNNTVVDATSLAGGINIIYLQGSFGD